MRVGSLPPFWRLVEQHGDELVAYARRLVGDDAEDVVQEALLKGLRAYPRLGRSDHLRAWLYRVTTTTAFDHHARRRRRRERTLSDTPEITDDGGFDDGGFEALIEPLNASAREALRLRFIEDLDYRDIAGRLGCSPDAARQRVSAAVRELRRRMTR